MSNINKVILIGRAGRDPETKVLESGANVAKLSIATTEPYKDKNTDEWIENTEWHEIVMWRYLAERAEKQIKKGALVYIEGKLKSRKWQKDGEETPRKQISVVADNFKLLSKKENSDNGYFPAEESAPIQQGKDISAVKTNLPPDDIPF